MYYGEESNHSNHLFHSMIQLARGLSVSNPNHSMMNTNPETTGHSSPECHYSPIHSMPWSTSIETETDYQRRKNFGSSLQILNQIPLDSTFNEVGRYFTNHVNLPSEFPTQCSEVATPRGHSSILPHTAHRSGYYMNVKFPAHQDCHTEVLETSQSLPQLKHSDYDDTITTKRLSQLLPNTNQNKMTDELVRDTGKLNRDSELNLAFAPMYTFRHRPGMETDTRCPNTACMFVDNVDPSHVIQVDKPSDIISTLVPKSAAITMNQLSQYYPNFPGMSTTITDTNPPANNTLDGGTLNGQYDQQFSYHYTKNPHSDPMQSESKLGMINDRDAFNSYYSNSVESSPKAPTVKCWSQDTQNDKLNPFKRIWSRDSTSSTNPASSELETHSLVAFAELFKQKRIKLGATQAEVGRALGDLNYGGFGCLSQSTICRFESLSLSQNNMLALKPILQAWLEQAEKRFLSAHTRFDSRDHLEEPDSRNSYGTGACGRNGDKDDLEDDVNSMLDYTFDRKRKRTSITGPEKRSLEAYFAIQPRPSSDQLKMISNKLKLPKSVVRVWFCNQRQKQKRLQTTNHTCSGTLALNVTSDSLCGLYKTSSPRSFSPPYQVIQNHWNMTGK